MALLGLLLLPANYRAGAEIAHAHSLIQLLAEAANGTIPHHHDESAQPGPEGSSSWFHPSAGGAGTGLSIGLGNARPDAAQQQESESVSSGVHLLLTAMTAIAALVIRQAPIAILGWRRSGVPPRILVPPPRWTLAAS